MTFECIAVNKRQVVNYMIKYKMICPICSAVLVASSRESAIWERCPRCKKHIWDSYDAMLAEIYAPSDLDGVHSRTIQMN